MRKLFDKEIDNHHEEELLLAQLAAWQLGLLPTTLPIAARRALQSAIVTWSSTILQVFLVIICTTDKFLVRFCLRADTLRVSML